MFDGMEADGGGLRKVGLVFLSIGVGLFSVFLYPLSGLLALAGLALGCYVLVKATGNPSIYSTGAATLIVIGSLIALFVFITFASQTFQTRRAAANEMSAIMLMRSISRAEWAFRARDGSGRYGTLDELAQAGLLDSDLANGINGGYRFSLRLRTNGFEAFAVPLTYGNAFGSGERSFYLDESGNLRQADKYGGEAAQDDELVT